MQVQPYLFFDGRAEEAIDFYKKTLGAEVDMLMRWKDCPDKSMCTPANENKVMHASLKIGQARVTTNTTIATTPTPTSNDTAPSARSARWSGHGVFSLSSNCSLADRDPLAGDDLLRGR